MNNKVFTLIILLFLLNTILIIGGVLYSQEDETKTDIDSSELAPKEYLRYLIDKYKELVKNNESWNERSEVIIKIRNEVDDGNYSADAFETLVEWYYKYGPYNRVIRYGELALKLTSQSMEEDPDSGELYFTRDTIYYMGMLYFSRKGYLDYGRALGYFKIVNGLGMDDYSAKADIFYRMGVCYKE
ncbi:MAG: hypothetical protein ACOCV8_02625, partial [Spirochaetota bacterium]